MTASGLGAETLTLRSGGTALAVDVVDKSGAAAWTGRFMPGIRCVAEVKIALTGCGSAVATETGWCRLRHPSVHQGYAYVGGTPDNPNVLDKEGGTEALSAFLALYDLTQDKRWVQAAAQAANYCESWVNCWNIPMPPGDPKIVYPQSRTTVGLSIIATGQSGSDDYMAGAPFLFYRVSLLTGDTQYRDFAKMLLYDTKQMLDWDGTLGCKYPGLLTEALSLPPLRGHGVKSWLPWLSVCVLQPMEDLRQTFGTFDLGQIERMPRTERVRRRSAYSRTRGF